MTMLRRSVALLGATAVLVGYLVSTSPTVSAAPCNDRGHGQEHGQGNDKHCHEG
jgi:hypothetical protein